MKIFNLLSLIALVFLVSCNSYDIKMKGSKKKATSLNSIALVNVYINPPYSPSVPIIDAAIYNGVFQNIYGDIAILHAKNADTVVKYMGEVLKTCSQKNVIYGEELYDKLTPEVLAKLDIQTYPPIIQNEDFPFAVIPKYSLNFMDFSNVISPAAYFMRDSMETVKPQLAKLCEFLNVDGLVFAYFTVPTYEIEILGIVGERALFERIFYFDKNGDQIFSARIKSELEASGPSDMEGYEKVFRKYFKYTNAFFRNIYNDESLDKYLDED